MIRVAVTGSTNDDVRRLAQDGAVHGTTVLADVQTAGRGRLGRRWESPPGANVFLSVLLRTELCAERVPLLTLAAAVAVAAACGPAFRIKWPNDVQAADGRKVAGILAEAEWERGRLAYVVLGVGVNVAAAPPLPTATCLAEHGDLRDRDAVAEAVRDGVLAEAQRLALDPGAVLADWRARSATLGREVRVGDVTGLALDVDDGGALLVRTGDGVRRVLAGDVEAP